MATIMAVNGSQFFDIYIPALGIEHRVQVADTRPAVRGLWDPAKRCVYYVSCIVSVVCFALCGQMMRVLVCCIVCLVLCVVYRVNK